MQIRSLFTKFPKGKWRGSKSMPRAILLLLISQAFNCEKTLSIHGSCEESEQSIPFAHPKEISKTSKCIMFSVHSPEHHLELPHPWDHTVPWLPQDPWKTAGRFWGFTALLSLQGYLQVPHEANTFPFGFPAVVTQEWESPILETLVYTTLPSLLKKISACWLFGDFETERKTNANLSSVKKM